MELGRCTQVQKTNGKIRVCFVDVKLLTAHEAHKYSSLYFEGGNMSICSEQGVRES